MDRLGRTRLRAKTNDPTLEALGLVQHESPEWLPRTYKNVDDGDATIVFVNPGDLKGGSKRTVDYAKETRKPVIVNPTPEAMHDFMAKHHPKTINMAGSRAYTDRENIRTIVRIAMGAPPPERTPSGYSYHGSTGIPSDLGTLVVNMKTGAKPDIRIDRANSKLGNMFTHRRDLADRDGLILVDNVEQAVERYEEWLIETAIPQGIITKKELAELSGHTLGCWDAPGPCHGDVLLRYADMYSRELGMAPEVPPAAVSMERSLSRFEDNPTNPFMVRSKNNARYRGRTHPFWMERAKPVTGKVDMPAANLEEIAKAKAEGYQCRSWLRGTQPAPEDPIELRAWKPVPYTYVATEEEAVARYYKMIGDMVDDPEYGQPTREYLDKMYHGTTLYQYASGDNADSRVLESRVLADWVDWIHSGMYDQAYAASKAAGAVVPTGRPTDTKGRYPYVSPVEEDIITKVRETVDMDAVHDMIAKYNALVYPAEAIQAGIDEERLVAELADKPDLLRGAFGEADDYATGQRIEGFNQEVRQVLRQYHPDIKEATDAMGAVLDKMGIEARELTDNFDAAYRAQLENPILTVATQAARRVYGPEAVIRHVKRKKGGYALVVDMPGGEQRSFIDSFNTRTIAEAKQVRGSTRSPGSPRRPSRWSRWAKRKRRPEASTSVTR